MAAVQHSDAFRLSAEVGANMRAAGGEGYLTDTNVNALTTVQGLRDLITNGVAHADQVPNKHRFQRAIDLGVYTTEFNDTDVAAVTTGVEGLINLTKAAGSAERHQMIQ